MSTRPIYVGVGECDCGNVDAQLYHAPGTLFSEHAMCAKCLTAKGFAVPRARTASDLEILDGMPRWKTGQTEPLVHVGKLELGYGHTFEVVLGSDDRLVGWLHTHPDARNPSAATCQSFCAVRELNGTPVHQVLCADPLTLTPSLKCRTCGAHGNVVNAKWEPL